MRISKGVATWLLFILSAGLLTLTLCFENSYLIVSFAFVIMAILFFLVRFERRKVEPKELVLLAVLAAIASAGRVPFASIPSVQPTTFVIMMSGFVFGAESGFIVGSTAALASNMVLGQGPWTPWQMVAWGLVGLSAGWLRNTEFMKHKAGQILFGAIWGYLFGWIMNIWGFLAMVQSGSQLNLNAFFAYMGASALFDSFHAASNVIFLLFFSSIWIKILTRFKRKYGLMEKK